MSTQACNNRQEPVWIDLPADLLPHKVLPPGDTYDGGFSINGGTTLKLEVDASQSVSNLQITGFRRAISASQWSPFYTNVAVALTVFTDVIGGLGGFADVYFICTGVGAIRTVIVSATINVL